MKTLVTYQVTNDHGLICLLKLNTSIVQTRLVNVRTTQNVSYSDESSFPLFLSDGRVGVRDIRLDRT